jgi:hypothetical protein
MEPVAPPAAGAAGAAAAVVEGGACGVSEPPQATTRGSVAVRTARGVLLNIASLLLSNKRLKCRCRSQMEKAP